MLVLQAARRTSSTVSVRRGSTHHAPAHRAPAVSTFPVGKPAAEVLPAAMEAVVAQDPRVQTAGFDAALLADIEDTYNFKASLRPDTVLPRLPSASDYTAILKLLAETRQSVAFEDETKPSPLEQPGYLTQQFDELRAVVGRVRERLAQTSDAESKADANVFKLARHAPPPPAGDSYLDPQAYVQLAKLGESTGNPQLVYHAVSQFRSAHAFLQATESERALFTRNSETVPASIAAMPQYQQLSGWLREMRKLTVRSAEYAYEQLATIDALQAEFDKEEQQMPYITLHEELAAHPEWVAEFNTAHREHRWFELDLTQPPAEEEHH